MESGHGSETTNGSKIHAPTASSDSDHFTFGKKLSLSSVSSGDQFELDDILVSFRPGHEQDPNHAHMVNSNQGSESQFPLTKMTEQPAADSSPSGRYRIPSAVFSRSTSKARVDWSAASNESLFSIHMGNMSFARDHLLGKSGELVLLGDSTISGPLIDYSSNEPPSLQQMRNNMTGTGQENASFDEVFGVIEPNCGKEQSQAKESFHSGSLCCRSDASGASVKSFAFPVLTGDDKNGSLTGKRQLSPQPETPKLQSRPRKSKVAEQPHLPDNNPEKTPGATARCKWFRCFCCWSCFA